MGGMVGWLEQGRTVARKHEPHPPLQGAGTGGASRTPPPQGAGKLTPLLTTTRVGRSDCRGGRDVSLPPSVPVPHRRQVKDCRNWPRLASRATARVLTRVGLFDHGDNGDKCPNGDIGDNGDKCRSTLRSARPSFVAVSRGVSLPAPWSGGCGSSYLADPKWRRLSCSNKLNAEAGLG